MATALTLVYILYSKRSGIDLWWYDTALCVPLGMIYSHVKDRIEKMFFNNNLLYYTMTLIVIGLYIGSTLLHLKNGDQTVVIFSRLIFTLAYVLVSMKISFNNKILAWLGKYAFAIYVIQRIPMLILQKYYLPDMNKYVYVIVSLILTLLLAFLFELLNKAVQTLFFEKHKKADLKEV